MGVVGLKREDALFAMMDAMVSETWYEIDYLLKLEDLKI